jgi:hypothetical protein
MDERRKRLLGDADDADVRGEHQYPDDSAASPSAPTGQNSTRAEEALTRQPRQYVAGAEGTQPIITPRRRD